MHDPSVAKAKYCLYVCVSALVVVGLLIGRIRYAKRRDMYKPEVYNEELYAPASTEVDAANLKKGPKPIFSLLDIFLFKYQNSYIAIGVAIILMTGWFAQLNYRIVHAWESGESSFASQHYVEAESIFRSAVQADPSVGTSHYNLARVLLREGKLTEAVPELKVAASSEVTDASVDILLGDTLQTLDRPAEAIPAYNQAIAISNMNPESYIRLGSCLAKLNRVDDAISQLRYAVTLAKDDVKANANLGCLLLANSHPDEGIRFLRKAVELAPADIAAHNTLANAYAQHKLYLDAASEFRAELAIDPDYGFGYFNLGSALKDAGKYDEAIQAYKSFLRKASANKRFVPGVPLAMKEIDQLQKRLDANSMAHR